MKSLVYSVLYFIVHRLSRYKEYMVNQVTLTIVREIGFNKANPERCLRSN